MVRAWVVFNNRDSCFACDLSVFIVPECIGVDHHPIRVVCTDCFQFQRDTKRMPATKAARILYREGGSTKSGQIQIANVNAKLPFAVAFSH